MARLQASRAGFDLRSAKALAAPGVLGAGGRL